MKRILSGVLRRRNGVERREGRAGALRIEFIERSRASLWVLNGYLWLIAWRGAREPARWKVSDGLPEWKTLVPRGCGRTFGNDRNDCRQSSAEVPIGTG
jgi:hypothetical protein